MSRKVTVRSAFSDDLEEIVQVLEIMAVDTTSAVGADANLSHMREQMASFLTNARVAVLVAQANGVIIGLYVAVLYQDLVSGRWGCAKACWYVLRTYRTGAGRALLTEALRWAQACGAVVFQSPEADAVPVRYLRRFGFRPTQTVCQLNW